MSRLPSCKKSATPLPTDKMSHAIEQRDSPPRQSIPPHAGLQGQQNPAQGNTLGLFGPTSFLRPERADAWSARVAQWAVGVAQWTVTVAQWAVSTELNATSAECLSLNGDELNGLYVVVLLLFR